MKWLINRYKIVFIIIAAGVAAAIYKNCNEQQYLPDNLCAKMTCKQREGFCIPCPVSEPPTVKEKD